MVNSRMALTQAISTEGTRDARYQAARENTPAASHCLRSKLPAVTVRSSSAIGVIQLPPEMINGLDV